MNVSDVRFSERIQASASALQYFIKTWTEEKIERWLIQTQQSCSFSHFSNDGAECVLIKSRLNEPLRRWRLVLLELCCSRTASLGFFNKMHFYFNESVCFPSKHKNLWAEIKFLLLSLHHVSSQLLCVTFHLPPPPAFITLPSWFLSLQAAFHAV